MKYMADSICTSFKVMNEDREGLLIGYNVRALQFDCLVLNNVYNGRYAESLAIN